MKDKITKVEVRHLKDGVTRSSSSFQDVFSTDYPLSKLIVYSDNCQEEAEMSVGLCHAIARSLGKELKVKVFINDGVSIEYSGVVKEKMHPDLIIDSKEGYFKSHRNKDAYEKVELTLAEKVEILDSGEWLYTRHDGSAHIDLERAKEWSLQDLDGSEFYRKITKPIEWWEDAAEYVNAIVDGGASCVDADFSMTVSANMNRDQWCDFARILLEQED